MREIQTEKIEELLTKKDYRGIKDLFELYPDIDIADACNEIPIENIKELIPIFRVVKSEYTSNFFNYLDDEHKEAVIKVMTDKEIVTLLDATSNDDIADFIEDMPANLVKKILNNTSKEDRTIINKLLNYKDDSAGSIMTTEFLEFLNTTTVRETIDQVRELGKDAETIYTIFVKDNKRNFLGTVDLDDLIFAKTDETLNDIMNRDFVTVDVNTDQEQVAELVRRYDLNVIAVLNDDKRLIGIITIDDIVDVIQQEANEDISLQAGVAPLENSYRQTSITKIAFKCIPWLVFLLIIDVFSSIVLSSFQGALAKVAILSAFIPTIMDTGGNAGSQTSSLLVRSLALNEYQPKEYGKIVWKEFRIALIVAGISAVAGFIWFLIEMYLHLVTFPTNTIGLNDWEIFEARTGISLLVSGTLFLTILLSKILGCVLPLIAKFFHKDPAIMSGPLITSIVDVSSLLIYFGLFELISVLFHVVL